MKTKVFVGFVLLIVSFSLQGQHIIGLQKDQIVNSISKYYPGFVQDNSSVNTTYKYLKFINSSSEQTLLVFLTDDDSCKSTKLMCDYMSLLDIKNDLNKKYKPAGKDKWTYKNNGENFVITLKRDKWFFTVYTARKEK